jgi:hypothetical protein
VTVVMFLRHEMTLTELGRSAKMLVPTPRMKSRSPVKQGKGRLRIIRVDIGMSDHSCAIHNTGHYHVRKTHLLVVILPDLQTTGTAAAAPASWLRSIWRQVTQVFGMTMQRTLRRICCRSAWSRFLSDRSLAKGRAGPARRRAATLRPRPILTYALPRERVARAPLRRPCAPSTSVRRSQGAQRA